MAKRPRRAVVPEGLVRRKVRIQRGVDLLEERSKHALGLEEGSKAIETRMLVALTVPETIGVEEGEREHPRSGGLRVRVRGRRVSYRPPPWPFPWVRRWVQRLAWVARDRAWSRRWLGTSERSAGRPWPTDARK